MLGQLPEAGNTTTLAHYLSLLQGAGLVTGLSSCAGGGTSEGITLDEFSLTPPKIWLG